MNYEIIELKEKHIVGLGIKTTNEDMKAATDIGLTWQRLMQEGVLERVNEKVDDKVIGLYTDYEGDHTKPYLFLAGTEVATHVEVHESLTIRTIPAGKYAKFTVTGDVKDTVIDAWQKIWELQLERTFVSDFEVYHNNGNLTNTTIDIFISI